MMWLTSVLLGLFLSLSASAFLDAPLRAELSTLPDDPCSLFTATELQALTDLEVTNVERKPSLTKLVEAERANREPGPGSICVYDTRSPFASIAVFVPPKNTRTTALYWADRRQYFKTFGAAAQPIPHLGLDAWLSGGADLHVLVRDNEYFVLSTQMYQPESRDLLAKIAAAVVNQF